MIVCCISTNQPRSYTCSLGGGDVASMWLAIKKRGCGSACLVLLTGRALFARPGVRLRCVARLRQACKCRERIPPFSDNDVMCFLSCLCLLSKCFFFIDIFMTDKRSELKGCLKLSGPDNHYPLICMSLSMLRQDDSQLWSTFCNELLLSFSLLFFATFSVLGNKRSCIWGMSKCAEFMN